jgi:hypothetical protein
MFLKATAEDFFMAFSFVRSKGHYSGSGTFLFVMTNGIAEMLCAVSDDVLDDADVVYDVTSRKRRKQFEKFKPRIIEQARRKYHAAAFERVGPLILVSKRDMRHSLNADFTES